MKHLIFLYLLISITFCYGQNEFKTYAKDNYTISYPENWDLDISGQMNTSLLLFSKPSSDTDDFRENVNVMIQDLQGMNLDMDGFVKISENQIKATPNSELFESKKLDDKYLMVWKGYINGFNLKFKQYFYIIKDKAYVITFTAKENEYESYIEIGNKIIDSLKLTN